MQEYEIEFYDKADGSEPVKEFILSLDKKMQAKVLRTVALLRERPRKHLLQRSHWQNNIAQIILPERRISNDKLQRFFE